MDYSMLLTAALFANYLGLIAYTLYNYSRSEREGEKIRTQFLNFFNFYSMAWGIFLLGVFISSNICLIAAVLFILPFVDLQGKLRIPKIDSNYFFYILFLISVALQIWNSYGEKTGFAMLTLTIWHTAGILFIVLAGGFIGILLHEFFPVPEKKVDDFSEKEVVWSNEAYGLFKRVFRPLPSYMCGGIIAYCLWMMAYVIIFGSHLSF